MPTNHTYKYTLRHKATCFTISSLLIPSLTVFPPSAEHQTIREEIDNYNDDYNSMMEYGERVTAEDVTPPDDPQYMFLRERLKALKDG